MNPVLRTAARSAAWWAADTFGVNALLRRCRGRGLLTVCYHGIIREAHPGDRLCYGNTVSADEFADQLAALKRWFSPVSAKQVREWLDGRARLPERPVLVTFDDGYRNNLTLAAPILRALEVPALVHVTTGHIGSQRLLWPDEVLGLLRQWRADTIHLPESADVRSVPAECSCREGLIAELLARCKVVPEEALARYLEYLREQAGPLSQQDAERTAFLSWEEVRALVRQGIAIGSHTVHHYTLAQLDPASLDRELVDSKRAIEEGVGEECYALAYPFGRLEHCSELALARARAAGYVMGFTKLPFRHLREDDRWRIGRTAVTGHLSARLFHAQVSGTRALLGRPV